MELRPFDPAEHLETEEDRAFYLSEAIKGCDEAHIRKALAAIDRSRAKFKED